MKRHELIEGMTVFFYHPDALWPKDRIVECKVVKENGQLRVKHVNSEHCIEFGVSDVDDKALEGYLFKTKEEVQQKIDSEFEKWKTEYENLGKQDFVNMVFKQIIGENIYEDRELEVTKDKFEKEFGIRPK